MIKLRTCWPQMNREYQGLNVQVRTPRWMQCFNYAGVSSVGSCVTAGHGFLYKSCGFGSNFSRMVIVRESRRKSWPPFPKLKPSALFVQAQLRFFFSSFRYSHAQVMPSACIHTKPSCRHRRGRSCLSVCHTRPEVSQSGLRVPAEPRWQVKPWNPTS